MNLADITPIYKDAVILNGTKTTPPIELEQGASLVGVFHPAMTTSTVINFLVSKDGKTYVAMEDGLGAEYKLTFINDDAGYIPVIAPELFIGFRFLKITVADSQVGDKTLTLAIRALS